MAYIHLMFGGIVRMTSEKEGSTIRQTDLEGKPAKRGRVKYRKLFSKHSKKKTRESPKVGPRADSESEQKVIAWLDEHGIAFAAHGAIPTASIGIDVNKLMEEILSGFSSEERELLTTKLNLRKIDSKRSVGRYDFKIEGTDRSTGKHEIYYIEYWGMYNPNVKITKENLRRLYNRLLVNYTFIKKPLKEKYYNALGLNLISLTRTELKKPVLDDKLKPLLNLDQRHLISRYMP
jgi:hypothetical protein